MKEKLMEYRELVEACAARMKQILTSADAESRDLSDAETREYDRLDKGIDACNGMIEKLAKVDAIEGESRRAVRSIGFPSVIIPGKNQDPSEFRDFGEFIHSVRFNPMDKRLEYREQSMGVGAEGGFMVPKQFRETLLQVNPQAAVIRSRATVIPAGDPPDAEISMPALNQSADENMFGGVEVTWIGEGQAKPETDARIQEIKLTPNEVAAHIVITDKLLRNWQAAGAVLGSLLRGAISASEDYQFLRGNGASKPQGIIGCAAEIAYHRGTANQISYTDVTGMLARARSEEGLIWMASRTIIPQLAAIVDAGSNNIFVQNAALGMPGTLYGIPLVFNERCPALGTKGDLILVDLKYYLIKDGSGPFVQASEHVLFRQNKTVIKAFWNVDGKPWLLNPIPLEGSTTNTVSPIVVLDVP
ncbi:MAG: phage major capsid protein [Syntrophaceae bacterium]